MNLLSLNDYKFDGTWEERLSLSLSLQGYWGRVLTYGTFRPLSIDVILWFRDE